MSGVDVNPEELKRFASFLEQTAGNLREHKTRIGAGKSALKEVWKDAQFEKFDQTFVKTTAGLDRFLKEADAYCRFLRKKADLAERYLRSR